MERQTYVQPEIEMIELDPSDVIMASEGEDVGKWTDWA